MYENDVKQWVTIKGNHVPIFKDGSFGGIFEDDNDYEKDLSFNIEKDLHKINPEKDNHNCQKCVLALEMQLRGKNVTATKNYPNKGFNLLVHASMLHKQLNHNWRENDFQFDGKISAKDAKDALKDIPNSRWYISIPWKGDLGSHAFSAIVDDKGKVKFYDPQNPDSNANSYFTHMSNSMKKHVNFIRLDNLEFDDEFIKNGGYFNE